MSEQREESTALVEQRKGSMSISPHSGVEINSLEDLWRFAQYVARSGFAPKGMEKPESVLVAVQMGLELGVRPMQAVQNIAVINGRPSIWGDLGKALVEGSGLCENIEESIEGTGEKMKAVCIAQRRGRVPVRSEFSVEDAVRAQLWKKAGPWTQYPKRMLQMRARAFALRDAFPDVLKGLYFREELYGDVIDVTPTVGTLQAPPKTADDLADLLESEQECSQDTPKTHEDAPQDDFFEPIRETPSPPDNLVKEITEIICKNKISGDEWDNMCEKSGLTTTDVTKMNFAQLSAVLKNLKTAYK